MHLLLLLLFLSLLIVGIFEELIKGFLALASALASGVDVGTLGLTTVSVLILFGDIVIINKWKTN